MEYTARNVLTFYLPRFRTPEEMAEDARIGLPEPAGRTIFCNLFPCDFQLGSNTTVDGVQIFLDPSNAARRARSVENVFQAAKCAVSADAQFVMDVLSPRDSAFYGQGKLVLTDPQRDSLVRFGVPAAEFTAAPGGGWTRSAPGTVAGRVPMRPDWDTAKLSIMMHCLRIKFAQDAFRRPLMALRDFYFVEHVAMDKQWADGGDGSGCNFLGKMITQVWCEIRDGRQYPVDLAFLRKPNREFAEYY
jgi:hypothetical protein